MGEETEPFVSIVTPFYNTDQYLSACIKSVLAQNYKNWEYILVNNCSTDKSDEIALKYTEQDNRIRLTHNDTFLTQVQNYNHALRQIDRKSKYCKIVQADDMILPECISKMVDVAEKDSSVGIVGAYRLCGTTVRNVGLNYPDNIYNGRDVCRTQLIYGGNYFGSPTSILFRSEIVRNRASFYSEDIYFEDTAVCFDILKTWNFGFVHQVQSWEREDNESISSDIRTHDPSFQLATFIMITKFGKHYFENSEFYETYNNIKKPYFRFLARNILERRNKEFWNYHTEGMGTVGYRLRYKELMKYLFLEIIDIFLSPVKVIGRMLIHEDRS